MISNCHDYFEALKINYVAKVFLTSAERYRNCSDTVSGMEGVTGTAAGGDEEGDGEVKEIVGRAGESIQ